MGNFYGEEQAFNVVPPRLGQIIALSVDSTSRNYDLTALLFNGVPKGKGNLDDYYYISFQAETNDVYFAFTSNTVGNGDTILDTTAQAAGTAPLLLDTGNPQTNAQCAHLVSGLPPVDMRIERQVDKTLMVKCASGKTATLRFWVSSQSMPGTEAD